MSQRNFQRRSESVTSGLLVGLVAIACCTPSLAQTVPDNTLGNERTQVNDVGDRTSVITGGARRGRNLLHSFRDFNVEEGGRVFFFNPGQIENILTRVTGDNPSNINGVLGTYGVENGVAVPSTANLYLMNPNGIIFGASGSLNVGGSFVGTTANAIGFGDRGFFSATNPEIPSRLLTVNPSAFLFNQIPIDDIEITSVGEDTPVLRVPSGENLALLGGNILVNGGSLIALGGQVDIGSVGGIGRVEIDAGGRFNFPADLVRADVIFSNGAGIGTDIVDETSNPNTSNIEVGNITITARKIELDNSFLSSGIASSRFGRTGNLVLDATGDILLRNESQVVSSIRFGDGESGDIFISASSLKLTDGSQIRADLYSRGRGRVGNINIRVRGNVFIEGEDPDGFFASSISSRLDSQTSGQGGDINIEADSLSLGEGAVVDTSTSGFGRAGNVGIEGNTISLLGGDISAAVENGGDGDGGNIVLFAQSLIINNGSTISSGTFGTGSAGNISIWAEDILLTGTDAVTQRNSFIFSSVIGTGAGGNITIEAIRFVARDGAGLSSSTNGLGNAGDVRIRASDSVFFDGVSADELFPSGVSSNVGEGGRGRSGDILISTDALTLANGAQLNAGVFGQGDGGNIEIRTSSSRFEGSGSGLFNNVGATAVGNGGNILIGTDSLIVAEQAGLVVSTVGGGDQGLAD